MRRSSALRLTTVLAAILAITWPGGVSARGAPVDCTDPSVSTFDPATGRHVLSGTVQGDLLVGVHGTICKLMGTVEGNVRVADETPACATRPPFTAIEVVGGSIMGNVHASGGLCAMVWLRTGARVDGNVVYEAAGNLGFLATATDPAGASVGGNVLLKGGRLWATNFPAGPGFPGNRVDGHIICDGGAPLGGLGSGTATDWDGWDGDVDGTLGGRYLDC